MLRLVPADESIPVTTFDEAVLKETKPGLDAPDGASSWISRVVPEGMSESMDAVILFAFVPQLVEMLYEAISVTGEGWLPAVAELIIKETEEPVMEISLIGCTSIEIIAVSLLAQSPLSEAIISTKTITVNTSNKYFILTSLLIRSCWQSLW
jgi:hypothetical protein